MPDRSKPAVVFDSDAPKRFMTRAEAAKYLGIDVITLDQFTKMHWLFMRRRDPKTREPLFDTAVILAFRDRARAD